MKFELFINSDGNCREAVEYYAKVFKSEVKNLMTYGETPADPSYTMPEADKNRIMYADVKIGDVNVMFMDMPSDMPIVSGNNINPTISTDDIEEVKRWFNELKEGGEVYVELGETFFSKLYGMVVDKYGIIWQIMYHEELC